MKKLKSILFFFIFFIISVNVFSQFGGGNGTKETPYKIYTKKQLYFIREILSWNTDDILSYSNWTYGKYFILMNDIKDIDKSIIGSRTFFGNFDGQGYKLTLAMDNGVGLFEYVSGPNVEIKNLIVDGYVRGSNALSMGGIVAYIREIYKYNSVTIKNCINAGTIYGENIGGIVSHVHKYYNNSENMIITNCINTGTLVGKNVNGIVCMENDD